MKSKAKKIFLGFLIFCLLICLIGVGIGAAILTEYLKNAPSVEDVEIIPGLFLPKREDRGEYGRRWFIEKKAFDKYFGEIHIPPRLYKQYLKKKKIDE